MRDGLPGVRGAIADAVEDPLVVVDDGRILDANRAFREWFDADEPTGEELAAVLGDHRQLY